MDNNIMDTTRNSDAGVKMMAIFAAVITVVGILFAMDVIYPIEHKQRFSVAKEYLLFYTPAFFKGIHVDVTDERPDTFNGLANLDVKTVSASSALPGDEYTAEKMVDGDLRTTWQEGNYTSGGENEYAEFEVDGKTISGISICSGFWLSQEIYQKNNRPKKIRIDVGGGSFTIDLTDDMVEHYICFDSPVRVTDINLVIKEAYAGKTGDCCITEVRFYGEK